MERPATQPHYPLGLSRSAGHARRTTHRPEERGDPRRTDTRGAWGSSRGAQIHAGGGDAGFAFVRSESSSGAAQQGEGAEDGDTLTRRPASACVAAAVVCGEAPLEVRARRVTLASPVARQSDGEGAQQQQQGEAEEEVRSEPVAEDTTARGCACHRVRDRGRAGSLEAVCELGRRLHDARGIHRGAGDRLFPLPCQRPRRCTGGQEPKLPPCDTSNLKASTVLHGTSSLTHRSEYSEPAQMSPY